MIKRFMELKYFLPELKMQDIDLLMLTTVQLHTIEKLNEVHAELDVVTKKLQEEKSSLADVSTYFGTLIEDYPGASSFLSEKVIDMKYQPF